MSSKEAKRGLQKSKLWIKKMLQALYIVHKFIDENFSMHIQKNYILYAYLLHR